MRSYIPVFLAVLVIFLAGCLGGQACPDTADPVCGSNGVTYKNSCLAKAANATIAHKGPCSSTGACVDSDGGKDLFAKGNTSAGKVSNTDSCVDSDNVMEYFCEKGAVSSKSFSCPDGYECKGGKCTTVTCRDSDGGVESGTKGTATSGTDTGTDECNTNGSLKEYFCENSKVSSKVIECASGKECSGGACVDIKCSDSDGGKDKFEKGTVKEGKSSKTDSCSDADTVKEYFCSGSLVKSEEISCGTGFDCVSGKCVESKCVDSDNGKDQFTKGTTTYDNKTYKDSCYSKSQVFENFCKSDSSVGTEKISCGTDHECLDGRCRRVDCTEDKDTFKEEDLRYEIIEYDDSDKLTLYTGDIVEINNGMILRLYSISGNETTFRLYEDFAEYQDNDVLCTESIDEGMSENDICGENTKKIEVDEVNDTEDFARIYLDEYYVVQYYTQEGSNSTWSGSSSSCPDDKKVVEKHTSYFYPYLDTESSGLDLDGENFWLFDKLAEIDDIDSDSISFLLDGEDHSLEDDDTFEYDGRDYEIHLTFHEGGLFKIFIEEA
ncbi:MAG: Kazal-type serine protease inhibitor domain-containing protein [Candidatus Thorarchaeota archaeon]